MIQALRTLVVAIAAVAAAEVRLYHQRGPKRKEDGVKRNISPPLNRRKGRGLKDIVMKMMNVITAEDAKRNQGRRHLIDIENEREARLGRERMKNQRRGTERTMKDITKGKDTDLCSHTKYYLSSNLSKF
jgi:hypothetical protein